MKTIEEIEDILRKHENISFEQFIFEKIESQGKQLSELKAQMEKIFTILQDRI